MRAVRVVNQTNGRLVAAHCAIAEDWLSRARGLLGRAVLRDSEALLLRPCRSIHALGMRFTFDAILLSRDLQVLALRAQIVPGTLFVGHRRAAAVLECAAGTIAATAVSLGDQLALQPFEAD